MAPLARRTRGRGGRSCRWSSRLKRHQKGSAASVAGRDGQLSIGVPEQSDGVGDPSPQVAGEAEALGPEPIARYLVRQLIHDGIFNEANLDVGHEFANDVDDLTHGRV